MAEGRCGTRRGAPWRRVHRGSPAEHGLEDRARSKPSIHGPHRRSPAPVLDRPNASRRFRERSEQKPKGPPINPTRASIPHRSRAGVGFVSEASRNRRGRRSTRRARPRPSLPRGGGFPRAERAETGGGAAPSKHSVRRAPNKKSPALRGSFCLVRMDGLEPSTSRLSGERSNQLSYTRVVGNLPEPGRLPNLPAPATRPSNSSEKKTGVRCKHQTPAVEMWQRPTFPLSAVSSARWA